MHKRYLHLYIILAVAVAAVVAGIALSPPAPANPMRILMPNAAGRVVFNHIQHVEEYGVPCQTCHHEYSGERLNPQPCGSCHGIEFNQEFIDTHQETFKGDPQACLTCHHLEFTGTNWTREVHDFHAEDVAENCQSCHHDTDIEPEPTACSSCHEALEKGQPVPQEADPPLLRDAVHARCASCHAHEDSFNAGVAGCADCHSEQNTREGFLSSGKADLEQKDIAALSSCAACHYHPPYEEVFANRMQAFHRQCGNCHEELSGPSVEAEAQQCNQCHIR
ncbi:cytochrome c family protein [Desulfovibrio sp. OttesenSCG-928-C14]|nr:cytochrome c family protein [Desulfovibrio sp. OttesenSCG-928-C14]